MLRIAVCDDNSEFIKQITDIISHWEHKPENTVCETFENGDELIDTHRTAPFDIILLDIVMPMLNGIETAKEIRQKDKNVKIVFLTSSSEFAVESYTVKANNYLLKPVSEKNLIECLDELSEELNKNLRTITVKGIHTMQKLAMTDIVYIEAQNKHIVFTMFDGTKIKTTEPLHLWEEKLTLDNGFFKCHRSYIVNINHIDTYMSKEIKMHSGDIIPIARSYQKSFDSAYFAVFFGRAGEDA